MKGAFRYGFRLLVASVLATLSAPICAAPAPQAAKPADLRVLVDVSGSMKHTDPRNLRVPAVRLLASLLPADARAGVWTFAQSVNMIVPPGPANAAWKKRAARAASRVNSLGLFTNIEKALDTATAGWRRSPDRARDIILLTDGMVDVSKNANVSAASRKRILDEVLPKLRKADIHVDTIALSKQADHQLMRALALGTGGSFQEVDDSAQLERVFLHLFERTTNPETVPIKHNRFLTDSSVKEATVLVFHPADAKPTELVSPAGKRFGEASPPANVRWHHEQTYDLITISHPEAGQWRLIAQVDPDNRVMVATDLQLHTDSLPNNVLAGEKLDIVADLTNKGKPIERKDFLKLLKVEVTATGSDGSSRQFAMQQTASGHFQTVVDGLVQSGHYELAVRVDGHTFQREQRQSVQVFDNPVTTIVTPVSGAHGSAYRVTFKPNPELVAAGGIKLAVSVSGPKGASPPPALQRLPDGAWQAAVKGLKPGSYKLAYQISGKTVRGRDFTAHPQALELQGPKPPPAPPTPAKVAAKSAKPKAAAKTPAKAPGRTNWSATLAIVGGTNALVLLPGAFGFVLWRRRRKTRKGPGDEI